MWIAIQNAVGARQGVGGGPTPPPYTPPLDSITAAVAYSVRKLNSTYSGDCMLVRRVSDGATQGIGFDSNGLIDVNALATFSGGSELTVKVWYDQAGGGFDLEQPNDAYLPTIYDGAAVTTSTSGKPCVRIVRAATSGPGEWLQNDLVSVSTAGDMDVFLVLHGPLTFGGDRYFWNSQAGPTTSGARWGIAYNVNAYVQQPGPATTTLFTSTPVPDNLQFILNAQYNPSGNTNTLVGNGTEFGTYTSSTTYRTDPYYVTLGARAGGSEGYNSFDISEIIHLPNYGVSNNESINLNINDYYQFTNLPYYSSGLLADYSGAAAAYSVRKLSNTAIKCMRVRQTVSPFDELDIGFTPAGDLDEQAIVDFGAGNPLVVSRWYDQSGQSNHAVQITPGLQPQIYNGTAVITVNGKPAARFNGTNSRMANTAAVTQANTFVMVNTWPTQDGNTQIMLDGINTTGGRQGYGMDSDLGVRLFADAGNYGTDPMTQGDQTLGLGIYNGTSSTLRLNGSAVGISSVGTQNADGQNLGSTFNGALHADMDLQEFIMWDSDQSTPTDNRIAIETNINTYYNVYPTSGFLVDYPGSYRAYSLRKLQNLAQYAIRVQRHSGAFDEQDIGFTPSGDLDTQAIIAFAGTDVVGVKTWYNQAHGSSAQDLTQSNTAYQPLIFDGTSVYQSNGKPAIYYDATDKQLADIASTGTGIDTDCFSVHQRNSGTGNFLFWYFSNFNVASMGTQYGWGWGAGTTGPSVDTDQHVFTGIATGTTGQIRLDGTAYTPGILSSTRRFAGEFAIQGNPGVPGQEPGPGDIYHQEIIQYDFNNTGADVTAIETNIGEYYGIDVLLLDTYTTANAGYSLRKLRTDYTGSAVRVRRDVTPFDEQDIGFDSYGNLDVAALDAFSAGAPLRVSIWYDQTTGGWDASNVTYIKQPLIHDGASVVLLNGKPAVDYENAAGNRSLNSGFGVITATADPLWVFSVTAKNTGATASFPKLAGPPVPMGTSGTTANLFSVWRGTQIYWGIPVAAGTQYLRTETATGTTMNGYIDGTLSKTNAIGASNFTTQVQLGGGGGSAHKLQEYIVFEDNMSADRVNLENTIKSYYGIP